MVKVLRTILQELALTFRGFVQFYLDFLAMIRPDATPRRTPWRTVLSLLIGAVVIAAIVFYLYSYPELETGPKLNAALVLLIGGIVVLAYAGWFVAVTRPRIYALKQLGQSLVALVALGLLIGHPRLNDWGMIVVAGVLLVGVVVVARNFLKRSARASVADRPLIRGKILALLPFYLIAIVCLLWGANTALKQPGSAWFIKYAEGSYDSPGWNEPRPLGGGIPKEQLNDTPELTTEISGYGFWGYVLQQCTGIAMAPAMEKVYWGLGTILGTDEDTLRAFRVGRLQSRNFYAELLENLIRLVTTIFFLGVFADIALTVQRRIQTGQVDLDLTKDHGVALLTAVHGLSGREEAKVVRGSWQMIERINDRAVDGLIRHLGHADAHVRAAAAWALGELGATRAASPLQAALDAGAGGETSLRAKAAMTDALARLAPLVAQRYLLDALRGTDPVLAHTALAAQTDVVDRVLAPIGVSSGNGGNGNHGGNGGAVAWPATTDDAAERRREAERRDAIIAAVSATLVAALDAPHDLLRAKLVRLLARLSPAATAKTVLARIQQPANDPLRWTEGAMLALGRLKLEGGVATRAAEVLIQHATNQAADPVLRVAALRGLGGHDSDEGLKVLRAALADSDATVRSAACAGLARRGNAVDLPQLVKMLSGDNDHDVQVAAIRALRRICSRLLQAGLPLGTDVVAPLRELAAHPDDSVLRDQACYALAELRDADSVDMLLKLLPDPEATDAIGMLGDPDLKRPLAPALRARAIEALRAAAATTASAPQMSRERNAPLEALGHYGRDASAVLQDLYATRPEDQRVIAQSLAATADPADANDPGVAYLVYVFDPRNRTSAEWLCPALAATRHPKASRALRDALHTGVAPQAARALGDMYDPDSLADLMQLANSGDESVREAVFSALRRLSADPGMGADITKGLQRQVRVMGNRAANVMRFMVRMAGSLLTLSDASDDTLSPERPGAAPANAARPEDLLAEFG